MDIIKNVIIDYEKLIKTNIQIPLSNGDNIKFTFNKQDLPHLLGLQYLVDNPFLFEYSQGRLSATELYSRMITDGDNAIDTNDFESSIYFKELYDKRIRYFSSELILDIIEAKQIIKFDSSKIKNFSTKLDKVEYMFWKRYKDQDNNYGYFGIGFMSSGRKCDINYPNTFFFRFDNDYIRYQTEVLPYSIMREDKDGIKNFKIYWDQVWRGLSKNTHYKKLKSKYEADDGELDFKNIEKSPDEDVHKHYELLQLDALDKIYLPYMKEGFRWTNDEKRFIWQKIKSTSEALMPNKILQLLNEYNQKR